MSSQSPKNKPVDHIHMLCVILFSVSVLIGIQALSLGNPPQGTPRKIVSDDFTKNRQEAGPSNSNSKSQGQSSNNVASRPRPHRTYRLASQPTIKARPSSTGSVIGQLGITIWRLRPVDAKDAGGRALIREKGKSSGWVPE